MVDLDVLAGRDVALVERRELLDRVCEGLHLLRAYSAVGELHADHLDVGLALAIDALLQAEADELLLGLLASQEAGGLGVEVVEFALENRDDVPRDVVVDLGGVGSAVLGRPSLWTSARFFAAGAPRPPRLFLRARPRPGLSFPTRPRSD